LKGWITKKEDEDTDEEDEAMKIRQKQQSCDRSVVVSDEELINSTSGRSGKTNNAHQGMG